MCTDQDEGGGDSSDGENSAGSNASAAENEEGGRETVSPPAMSTKLSIVSPEMLMQR
jgi:hypothetical protein